MCCRYERSRTLNNEDTKEDKKNRKRESIGALMRDAGVAGDAAHERHVLGGTPEATGWKPVPPWAPHPGQVLVRQGSHLCFGSGAAGASWRSPPGAAIANWFGLIFDARGNFATGFEKCMLPGNINERIVLFANKHEGFDAHLFSKTGQMVGARHRRTRNFEQKTKRTKTLRELHELAQIVFNHSEGLLDHETTDHRTQNFEQRRHEDAKG